jgi:peptidoglycan/LPS O-acetylase OafA/YrhL
LDGLPGLLALGVVVSHIVFLTGAADIRMPAHLEVLWSDVTQAQPAVETFIILSGFAISFLLHARPQSYLEFITGRFFRIVPGYFICLALRTLVAFQFTPWLLSHASWKECSYFAYNFESISTSTLQHPLEHLAWHLVLLHGAIPGSVLSHSATALLPPAWSIPWSGSITCWRP